LTNYDEKTARLTVYTFKEGLLSSIAHDLAIEVTRFIIEYTPEKVVLVADASSLRTRSARENHHDAPRLLSISDKKKIDQNIVRDVLRAESHPQIRAESMVTRAGSGIARVTLAGVTDDVPVVVERHGDRVVARARLFQPSFGIKPYTALLGALKIKPEVEIELEIPNSD
jgi:hypothetical protein